MYSFKAAAVACTFFFVAVSGARFAAQARPEEPVDTTAYSKRRSLRDRVDRISLATLNKVIINANEHCQSKSGRWLNHDVHACVGRGRTWKSSQIPSDQASEDQLPALHE